MMSELKSLAMNPTLANLLNSKKWLNIIVELPNCRIEKLFNFYFVNKHKRFIPSSFMPLRHGAEVLSHHFNKVGSS